MMEVRCKIVSRPGSALPAGSSQFLQTQRGLLHAVVRGVQTVLSSLQPVAIFLSASSDVTTLPVIGLLAAIPQDVDRGVADHDLLFSDRVSWACCPLCSWPGCCLWSSSPLLRWELSRCLPRSFSSPVRRSWSTLSSRTSSSLLCRLLNPDTRTSTHSVILLLLL